MTETLPKSTSRSEAGAPFAPESPSESPEPAAESSRQTSEGPGESTHAKEQENLRRTQENLEAHAQAWNKPAHVAAAQMSTPVQAKPDSEFVHGMKHVRKGTVGAGLWAGKNLLAVFGLLGAWALMALKGAGTMAGGTGGGGHAKKSDHGGGGHH